MSLFCQEISLASSNFLIVFLLKKEGFFKNDLLLYSTFQYSQDSSVLFFGVVSISRKTPWALELGSAVQALALVRWRLSSNVNTIGDLQVCFTVICFLGCSCFRRPLTLWTTCCLTGCGSPTCPQTTEPGPTRDGREYPQDLGDQMDGWTNISWSSLSLLKIKKKKFISKIFPVHIF